MATYRYWYWLTITGSRLVEQGGGVAADAQWFSPHAVDATVDATLPLRQISREDYSGIGSIDAQPSNETQFLTLNASQRLEESGCII